MPRKAKTKRYSRRKTTSTYRRKAAAKIGYRKYRPKKTASTMATRLLRVYMDPFSTDANLPRVPDGIVTQSVGYRQLQRTAFELQERPTDILLFPGFNAALAITETRNTGTTAQKWKVIPLTDVVQEVTADTITAANPTVLNTQPQDAVDSWRIVSAGMNITLTNNAEDNDGFWESVRLSVPSDTAHYILAGVANSVPVMCPWYPMTTTDQDLARLPSYASGPLRNIGAINFNLRPQGTTHEMKPLAQTYTIAGNEKVDAKTGNPQFQAGDPAKGPGILLNNNTEAVVFNGAKEDVAARYVRDHIDSAFDCILVRLHGNTGTVKTKIKIISVVNQEITFDERAKNSKFHQRAIAHPSFQRARNSLVMRQNSATVPTGFDPITSLYRNLRVKS